MPTLTSNLAPLADAVLQAISGEPFELLTTGIDYLEPRD